MPKKINADTENRIMSAPQGEFELERVPPDNSLQAWDSADLYLLKQVYDNQLQSKQEKTLLVNDNFGALSLALADSRPSMMSDSYLAKQALIRNQELNASDADQVTFSNGIELPSIQFGLVLIKIPKSLALLEHQLYSLRKLVNKNTQIIAAGKTRHIHNSTLALFEKILGPSSTTLAWKKSRLIHVSRDESLNQGRSPYPNQFELVVDREYTISSHAGVFSREKLDAGTRLMIENIPVAERYRQIADLGCGNGVLGLVAASFNTEAELKFIDESYMAVDSARINFESAFDKQRTAQFTVCNCMQDIGPDSIDLILNNPPFHQQHNVGDSIAWQMFIDSRRALRAGGELWVVGNRHLGYHAKLKKIFGNCEAVASNGKYVLLKSVKKA